MKDVDLLKYYETKLQTFSNLMIEYISIQNDTILDVFMSGVPSRLSAREFKEHINLQMMFLIKKIEEVKNRIENTQDI